MSKIFEKLLCDDLQAFMKDKLSPLLCGYRKQFSAQHALLRLIEKWKVSGQKWHHCNRFNGLVHVPNFGGVAGSEDFVCATLPTTPLDFQSKIKNFCHPTLLKIRFKITVTPLPSKNGQSQNYGASISSDGLLTLLVDF